MGRTQGTLIALGTSHHTAPIEIREKFSLSGEQVTTAYQHLTKLSGVQEVALLSTCNRTEVYAVTNDEQSIRSIGETFCDLQKLTRDSFLRYGFERRGTEAVRHLFAVAAGLDSLVVGETEIIGQVKDAYTVATENQSLGPLLNRLFQRAFQAAKWVRTHTSIGKGQVSVGTVAVDLALKIFGNLSKRKILLIGAGEISERTITALKSRGATALTICNRTDHRAMDLATLHGGNALPFDQLPKAIGEYDIAICSTASPTPVLTSGLLANALRKRNYQPLFIIDLAIPRDVEEQASRLENLFLYNIDDLSQIAQENLAQRHSEIDRCMQAIERRAEYFWKNLRHPATR